MDITTLAAWGEFLGGIGVIVSLFYLAAQIRTNTKTVGASNYDDVATAANEFNTLLIDPEIATLYVRGLDDFAGLSAEDQTRFGGLMGLVVNSIQKGWILRERGLLDDAMWAAQVHSRDGVFANSGVRQWWEASGHWWPAGFREFIQSAGTK